MKAREVSHLSATQMVQKVKDKELSPVQIMEACLEQVNKHNSNINAICSLSEKALEQAKEEEQKVSRGEVGLLCGVPAGIKDITEVAGLRTTYGCSVYKDNVPTEDALVVQRLKEAGAIILGKTNTPEFATGGNTFNQVFGRTSNPWNQERSAGGSTGGGAAALATGMIALAEGTDLGGSLRIPASFCGIVGLRPSPGLIPTYPSHYLWDQMQVTGPMARFAEDIALMLQATSGPSPLSPMSQPTAGRDFIAGVNAGIPKDCKIAYCPDIAGIGIDPEVEKLCRKAALEMSQTGASVEEIEFDLSFAHEPFLSVRGHWMIAQHTHHLDKLEHFDNNLANNIKSGLKVTMEDMGKAEQARKKMWHTFMDFREKFDYLLTPCMAVPPFPIEQNFPKTIAGKEMKTYIDWVAPTFILSLSSLPVASVPCGLTEEKLPVGIQIVGKPLGEEKVLALAKQMQSAHPIGLPKLD